MNELKERRKAAGLTQAVLAKRVGCKQPTIGNIERGVYPPSPELLAKLEGVLDGKRVPKKRTAEEQWWHELWRDRYE